LEDFKEKNKFIVGELVAYSFPNLIGVQEKIGIILDMKESPLYGWTYTVKWNNGEEQTYAQQHLRRIV